MQSQHFNDNELENIVHNPEEEWIVYKNKDLVISKKAYKSLLSSKRRQLDKYFADSVNQLNKESIAEINCQIRNTICTEEFCKNHVVYIDTDSHSFSLLGFSCKSYVSKIKKYRVKTISESQIMGGVSWSDFEPYSNYKAVCWKIKPHTTNVYYKETSDPQKLASLVEQIPPNYDICYHKGFDAVKDRRWLRILFTLLSCVTVIASVIIGILFAIDYISNQTSLFVNHYYNILIPLSILSLLTWILSIIFCPIYHSFYKFYIDKIQEYCWTMIIVSITNVLLVAWIFGVLYSGSISVLNMVCGFLIFPVGLLFVVSIVFCIILLTQIGHFEPNKKYSKENIEYLNSIVDSIKNGRYLYD